MTSVSIISKLTTKLATLIRGHRRFFYALIIAHLILLSLYTVFYGNVFKVFAMGKNEINSIFNTSHTSASTKRVVTNSTFQQSRQESKAATGVSTKTASNPTTSNDQQCGYFVRNYVNGRLGNDMFVYASFYGLAKSQEEKGGKKAFLRVPSVPSHLDQVFENLTVSQRIVPNEWLLDRNFVLIPERYGCCVYDNFGLDVECDGSNVIVDGYRQSFKYFVNFSNEIKREFKFKRAIRKTCKHLFKKSLSAVNGDKCVTVGVHLRRGDFLSPENAQLGHWPAEEYYLSRAVNFFEIELLGRNDSNDANASNSFPGNGTECVVFLIFGNDYEWNRKMAQNVTLLHEKRTHLVLIDAEKSEPAVDMCAIGLCDHAAITTGTFSWWCGFFSRGIVTRQKAFAKPGSAHSKVYKVEDFYPNHWIPL